MPSVVDQRLAAEMHKAQIERLLRVEGIADESVRIMNQVARQLLDSAIAGDLVTGSRLARTFPQQLVKLLDDRFRRLAQYVHREGVQVLARVIPRRWFRLAKRPAGVAVGEADGLDMVNLGPAAIGETPTEPVAGKRMGDEAWAKFVEQNILPPPSAAKVTEILQRPTAGLTYSERLTGLSKLIAEPERLMAELANNYSQGQSRQQLAATLAPFVDNVKASAQRIARTEGLRIANQTQRETYDDMGDMIQGYQIVATLDQNTRPAHALRNGTIYYREGRPPLVATMPELPDAPNCRCFEVPVLQPPEEFENDPAVMAEFKTANGAAIPDPAAYDQWFDQADEGRRRLAVGSRRYDVVKQRLGGSRPPQWTDFIEPNGELMSVFKLQGTDPGELFREKAQLQATINARNELLQQVRTTGFSDSRLSPAGTVAQREPAPIRQPGQTRRMPPKKVLDELATITDKLPKAQRNALIEYTKFEEGKPNFAIINKKLRDGIKLNKREQAAYEKVQAAAKSGTLPPGLTVYRGLDFWQYPDGRNQLLKRAKKSLTDGVPFVLPGLNSTSVNWRKATEFAKPNRATVAGKSLATLPDASILLEIRPKTGISLGRLSAYTSEAEILQPDGLRYQVIEIRESSAFADGTKRVVVILQEL